jgi:hypothetical protein
MWDATGIVIIFGTLGGNHAVVHAVIASSGRQPSSNLALRMTGS